MSNKPRLWTGDFMLLVLISFLAFGMCQALNNGLPLYAVGLGETTAFAGFLLMLFSGGSAVTRLFVGRIIDKHGRRKMMIAGCVVMLIGTVLAIPFFDPVAQIPLRVLQGIGFSCTTTAASTASVDVLPESRLGEGVGYFSLGQSLGMAVGPALGVILASMAWRGSLFLGASAVVAACLICTCCSNYEKHPERLPETSAYRRRCYRSSRGEEVGADGVSSRKDSSSSSIFVKSALTGAIPMFAYGIANAIPASLTALYATQRGLPNPGLFFVLGAVFMTAVRLGGSRLFDSVRPRITFSIAIACGIIMFILLACADSDALLYTAGVFFGLSMGLGMPLMISIAMKATDPKRWGAANALVFLSVDIGMGFGAVMWGAVADAWGFTPVMIGGAIVMVLTFLCSLVTFPKEDAAS